MKRFNQQNQPGFLNPMRISGLQIRLCQAAALQMPQDAGYDTAHILAGMTGNPEGPVGPVGPKGPVGPEGPELNPDGLDEVNTEGLDEGNPFSPYENDQTFATKHSVVSPKTYERFSKNLRTFYQKHTDGLSNKHENIFNKVILRNEIFCNFAPSYQ